jgi:hypothetical protein
LVISTPKRGVTADTNNATAIRVAATRNLNEEVIAGNYTMAPGRGQ